ncbi:MAG: serine protease, partial [Pseudomonadota bacterium]|nr:serine protease [Pseudomonadota bacterium]
MKRQAILATRTAPNRAAQAVMALIMGLALVMAQTIAAEARGAPESFADLADQVSPAVVNITTSTTIEANTGPGPVVP